MEMEVEISHVTSAAKPLARVAGTKKMAEIDNPMGRFVSAFSVVGKGEHGNAVVFHDPLPAVAADQVPTSRTTAGPALSDIPLGSKSRDKRDMRRLERNKAKEAICRDLVILALRRSARE